MQMIETTAIDGTPTSPQAVAKWQKMPIIVYE